MHTQDISDSFFNVSFEIQQMFRYTKNLKKGSGDLYIPYDLYDIGVVKLRKD